MRAQYWDTLAACVRGAGLALSLMTAGSAAVAAATTDACMVPADFPVAPPLDHVAAQLRAGGKLDIVAVGSLTLTNPDPASPRGSFPFQMADALRALEPGSTVTLSVRGGKGLTARDMLGVIRAALAEQPYRLVIWQTGAVDAVHGVPPAEFARTLEEGADLIARAGADLVLVDVQYSRLVSFKIDLRPYEDAMRQLATRPGVALFPRYDLMRFWAGRGTIDLERVPRVGQEHAMGLLQSCLGHTLAQLVAGGAAAAR